MKKLLLAVLCLCSAAWASTTTLTGSINDAQGNGLNGLLVMQLPMGAQDITTSSQVAATPVFFRLVNGAITGGAPLYDVANLRPTGLYYITNAYDATGKLVFNGNFYVTGTTFNLGAATPTNITTSNVSFANPVFTSATITGALTGPQLNHKRIIDGTTYAATGAGFQQAISDCNADALCPGVDTGIIAIVNTTTTTALAAGKVLWVMPGATIQGTSDPVFSFPTGGTSIIGPSVDLANGLIAALRSTAAGSRVIAPATPGSNSNGLFIFGVDVQNQSLLSTAAIIDLTNTNNSRIAFTNVQRNTISGTVPNILVKTTGSNTAFFNDFVNVIIQGPGEGYDFETVAGAVSGASENHITGGAIHAATDCIAVNLVGSTGTQVNNVNTSQLDCEGFLGSVLNVQGPAKVITFVAPRMESSSGGATISNIANLGTISTITYIAPYVAGSLTRGTENGKVSWKSYQGGAPGPATEDLAVGSATFTGGITNTPYSPINLLISLTAPQIAAAGCGGAAATIPTPTNGTAAFTVNVGTTPGSACTITFPTANRGWHVLCDDITTQSTSVFVQKQTGAESTTSVTITNFNDVAVATAFVASDVLKCTASAY